MFVIFTDNLQTGMAIVTALLYAFNQQLLDWYEVEVKKAEAERARKRAKIMVKGG